ncbi:MAG: gluconeogenesis factor YvcK family protein [Microthrixaceae bacterium]
MSGGGDADSTGTGSPHLHLVSEATGPRVVAIGGGHGLAATLRATRTYAGDITAVVSVADDGGSTGRLRAAQERPAPGDLRKCLVALADESSLLARALEHRFGSGELDGHAFGNLMIVALAETDGDLVAALDELGSLLQTAGRVLPTTTDSVELQASRRSGDVVDGQVAVGASTELSTVRLVPEHAPACAEAVRAIRSADQIVLGPGSLFTSVLAATAVDGIRVAVAESDAQFVYVCNLRPQPPETADYGVAEHVAALARHGLEPDVVLYDPDAIGGAEGVGAAVPGVLARPNGLAHDPVLLGKALESISPR